MRALILYTGLQVNLNETGALEQMFRSNGLYHRAGRANRQTYSW